MIYQKNLLLWLFLLVVVGAYGSTQTKVKVCIVGAGPSGLNSVKLLSENLDNVELIVFEKGSDIGGQWQYTDSTDLDEHGLPVLSGMYKYLRTNAPKVLMSFPDYREFGGENRSYVRHEHVLQYLHNYTNQYNLRQYIKLDTLVEKVIPTDDENWHVVTRNFNQNTSEVYTCDALLLCSGHFAKPNVPNIPGLDKFTGRSLHSHAYRRPEEFANQVVVVLGASFSGIDIGIEVSDYAKRVYLSHRHKKITSELPENMIQIPGVVAASDSELILSNGSRVQADAFIICTGYLYDFPFLDETSGTAVAKGKYVHPLYKQLINVNHPTMLFVGLPHPGFPFVIPYVQVQYFISLFLGKAKLPSREVMLKDSQLPPGTPVSKAHVLEPDVVLKYYDDVAKSAGIATISKPIKEAALIYVKDKNSDVWHFKDHDLIIRDDGRVELIK